MGLSYFTKRILYNLLVLWGVISLVFVLFNVLPADPARLTMGQRSDIASVENVRKELNLDKSLPVRYLLFLNDLSPLSLHKDSRLLSGQYNYVRLVPMGRNKVLVLKQPYLGRSYRTKKMVSEALSEALPGTAMLAISAMLIATILGIGLGMLAAFYKDTIVDVSAVAASVAGISLPSFFSAMIVAYLFGYLLHAVTGLDMTGSLWEYDPLSGSRHVVWQNLLLPALALGVRPLAIITQLTRSSLLDVLGQDYIRTAYAKGLGPRAVLFRHALPNALNPVVTAISGWMAELLAGSFFVEFVFGWKGLGKLTVDALDRFDFPIVMGSVIVSATIFVVISVLADWIYTRLDPRIRLSA